jgi:ABC-type Fe3+ transport system permease subunit
MARVLRSDWDEGHASQAPLPAAPPRRRARWRFRWGRFVGWPLACLLAIAAILSVGRFLAGVGQGVTMPTWDSHFDWQALPQTTRLGLLGAGLIVIVALLRIARDRSRRQ